MYSRSPIVECGGLSDATTIDGTQGDGPSGEQPRRAFLVVRQGERTQVIDLHVGDDLLVGRAADATVRLDDARASREHARVRRRDDAITLVDLGGRNGTRVNGERVVGERPIGSGDVIAIGQVEIVVAETSGAASPTAIDAPDGIVVADAKTARVFELVARVAPTPTTVLILGETGVGKELVAERVHQLSPRATAPFVRLNCGSLPPALLESELFGHEKGAFTGADRKKLGYLDAAAGGTLFLDEIGELALELQPKLLRVLESRRFMRVGGRDELGVDVRIIAATNRALDAEVRAGRFREDLYFRLAAFPIEVPPLRERRSELALLTELFLRRYAIRMGVAVPAIAPDAAAAIARYAWPGNVRELRNAIERALVIGDGRTLRAADLPAIARPEGAATSAGPMRDQIADVELRAIEAALAAEHGNQTHAAKRLGISRRMLIYKMAKYRLGKKRST